MRKIILLLLLITTTYADVNQAVDNFFNSITADVNVPTVAQNQSAGVLSLGGVATRSQTINFQPVTFTPPSFNSSCGNINFYTGSFSYMTNTAQLVPFLQNTLMTAGITAVMTALKAVTPNIAGTLQSMSDAAQKMLGVFNNSCQLGMALGNSADSWLYDRIAKAKSQAYSEGGDASGAEINSTVSGAGSGTIVDRMDKITKNYQNWVDKNAFMNPSDITAGTQEMAVKYGSIVWKGMQALHLYSLPMPDSTIQPMQLNDVASIANLVISLTGDLIIYAPNNDGTGTASRRIPPVIIDIRQFMTTQKSSIPVYNCSYFSTINPGECSNNKVDLSNIVYPTSQFNGGIIKRIEKAINNIQNHFIQGTPLTHDDLFIIAIAPMPIFSIAQTLDDIGMSGSISNFLSIYSEQIAFEVLQKLVNVSFNLANQAASARMNKNTEQSIQAFTRSISDLQSQVNSYAYIYVKKDPVEILQQLNYLRGYAQNLMSPSLLQKVNFAKQMSNY